MAAPAADGRLCAGRLRESRSFCFVLVRWSDPPGHVGERVEIAKSQVELQTLALILAISGA
eukprot:2028802-Prymnesium_polylepis.1